MTRARAKCSSAKAATKKKTPKYRLIKFEPLPREGVNLAAEFIRLGQSVGGVDLKLPPRTKPRTFKPRVTPVEAEFSAKTVKKKAPRCRRIKFQPLPRKGANLVTEFVRLGQSVGGVNLELPPRSKPRTFKPRVTRAEAESSPAKTAKTAKKKAPKYRKFKTDTRRQSWH